MRYFNLDTVLTFGEFYGYSIRKLLEKPFVENENFLTFLQERGKGVVERANGRMLTAEASYVRWMIREFKDAQWGDDVINYCNRYGILGN